MTQAGLGLRLKQQLTLTPRLQQSVKLLQLSALECVQELNQAIAQKKAEAEAKAAAAAEKAARSAPPTAAEMKAARDARYAARKNRK